MQRTEVSPKRMTPAVIARRAPMRSERFPAHSSRDANTSVYPSTTHCSAEVPPPSSRPMELRAMFTMRMSRVVRKNAPLARTRVVRA